MKKQNKNSHKAAVKASENVTVEVNVNVDAPATEEAPAAEAPTAEAPEADSTEPKLTRISNAHAKLMIAAAQRTWDANKETITADIAAKAPGKKVTRPSVIDSIFTEEWFEKETGLKLIDLPYNTMQIHKLMTNFIKL